MQPGTPRSSGREAASVLHAFQVPSVATVSPLARSPFSSLISPSSSTGSFCSDREALMPLTFIPEVDSPRGSRPKVRFLLPGSRQPSIEALTASSAEIDKLVDLPQLPLSSSATAPGTPTASSQHAMPFGNGASPPASPRRPHRSALRHKRRPPLPPAQQQHRLAAQTTMSAQVHALSASLGADASTDYASVTSESAAASSGLLGSLLQGVLALLLEDSGSDQDGSDDASVTTTWVDTEGADGIVAGIAAGTARSLSPAEDDWAGGWRAAARSGFGCSPSPVWAW